MQEDINGLSIEERISNVFFHEMEVKNGGQIRKMLINQFRLSNFRMQKDGDQWMCISGENLQIGIGGFGKTKYEAWNDFINNYIKELDK